MEPDNIAQWITVVGGAIVGLWAIARNRVRRKQKRLKTRGSRRKNAALPKQLGSTKPLRA